MTDRLFIEAEDVWLFRDGKPFTRGGDHAAHSIFPPFPTVIQGAIRSKELGLKLVDLGDKDAIIRAVGTATDFANLRLRGPYLAEWDEPGRSVHRYFPVPADAVSLDTNEHTVRRASLPQVPPEGAASNYPLPMMIGLDEALTKGESGLWLNDEDLERYFAGEKVRATPADQLFKREMREGIAIDRALKRSEDGMLYQADFIRTKAGIGLAVDFVGYTGWPTSGLLQLGGESRPARYSLITVNEEEPIPNPLPRNFFVYFTTPTYFKDGWKPDVNKYFTGKVEIAAAAVSRPSIVAGFDMTASRDSADIHRSGKRFVPAGSVYYFTTDGPASLRENLVQSAITDYAPEIGFGQIILKEWKNV